MSSTTDKLTAPFIYEEADTLSLHFGRGGAVQSTMSLDAPDLLVFAYTRMMMSFLLFIERPKHIGIVGLGGGSIPKHCYRYLPDTQISVAEISPEVIALRNRFLIPNDDRRFRVHCEDGAEFIKRHAGQFDVLIVDGFDNVGQPPQLCSQTFYSDCHRALAREGVLVVNVCDFFPQMLIRRIRQCFEGRVIALGVEDSTNEIVCAGKGNVWWKSEDHLKRNQIRIQQRHSIDLRRVVREFVLERELRPPRRSMTGLTELSQEN